MEIHDGRRYARDYVTDICGLIKPVAMGQFYPGKIYVAM